MDPIIKDLLNKCRILIKYGVDPAKCFTYKEGMFSALALYNDLLSVIGGRESMYDSDAMNKHYPIGSKWLIEHDDFNGKVIGYYTTDEGKKGVVMQQLGTRVVHVYGAKWLVNPSA